MKAMFLFAALQSAALAFSSIFSVQEPDEKLQNGQMNIIADRICAEPGETVAYSVRMAENPGYASASFRLVTDERLTVALKSGNKPIVKLGDACDSLTAALHYSTEKHSVGIGTMGSENETDNGIIFVIEVTVPNDAKPGDIFPMTLDCKKISNKDETLLSCHQIDGYIRIPTADKPPVPIQTYLLGDPDEDGEVTAGDAQYTLRCYTEELAGNPSGMTDLQRLAADIDEDQKVTAGDAQLILKYYVADKVIGKPVTWEALLAGTS